MIHVIKVISKALAGTTVSGKRRTTYMIHLKITLLWGDSGGGPIGTVFQTGKPNTAPILLGVLSGAWHDNFFLETEEGEVAAATYGVNTQLRNFFQANVFNVPEATIPSAVGPNVAQMAVYGTHGGILIDDRVHVLNNSGGWGTVGSNPDSWLGCYGAPLSSSPGVASNMVDIQSNFNGVLIAPNAYIHAVPGKHHYGAFYGRTVYLKQDTEFEHRPFNAPLPLQ